MSSLVLYVPMLPRREIWAALRVATALALAGCSPSPRDEGSRSLSGAGGQFEGTGGVAGSGLGGVAGSGLGGVAGSGLGGSAPGPTTFLSETGLYADISRDVLAPQVMAYEPQFALWTDGAAKRRWIYLPLGTQIDNTNPDEWKFPVGTKLWKEFSRDDVRIETRMLEKLPPERASEGFEGWRSISFVWNDDLSDAVATPMGLQNAKGTDHDVPSQEACGRCHDMRKEKPLGVSAVQLSHDGGGATLLSLSAAGLLKVPVSAPWVVPGDAATREVLGYLHANCGHCHRERAPANNRVSSMLLWLESSRLANVEDTPAYESLVNHFTESSHGSLFEYRVHGGDPEKSEIIRRMSERGGAPILAEGEEIRVPMPPLGTDLVDTEMVTKVRAWIATLPAPPPSAAGGAPSGSGGASP